MSNQRQGLLTLNAGSSSIKFALYTVPALEQLIIGQIDGIGSIAAFKPFMKNMNGQLIKHHKIIVPLCNG
jgi:acetate kinase